MVARVQKRKICLRGQHPSKQNLGQIDSVACPSLTSSDIWLQPLTPHCGSELGHSECLRTHKISFPPSSCRLRLVEGGTEERRCGYGGLGCLGEGGGLELVVAGLGMSGGHSPMKGSGVMAPGRGEGTRRL